MPGPRLLRPYCVVIDGHLELGLEVIVENGRIEAVGPHTGIPDPFVLSPAFVNAHSHLEYRGLQGKIRGLEYWLWIRELTRLKGKQTLPEVLADARVAAAENRRTGVALIGEHSDRPVAGEAMTQVGLEGIIFQEVITFFEQEDRTAKLTSVRASAFQNSRAFGGPVVLSPHAYFTVDRETLAEIGASDERFSIHVAETAAENEFTREGQGLIAEFYRMSGFDVEATGRSVFESLEDVGLVRPGAQFVHCCDLERGEIERMARARVSAAHCPRSNATLRCPPAPIREMLDAGIDVGLGMDSAASSGPIDMFAEMRAALATSEERGRPISPAEVWFMATEGGARSLGFGKVWEITAGADTPLIKIHVPTARSTEDILRAANPSLVEWV